MRGEEMLGWGREITGYINDGVCWGKVGMRDGGRLRGCWKGDVL